MRSSRKSLALLVSGLAVLFAAAAPAYAQTWKIVADPKAVIYRSPGPGQGTTPIQLGVGTAEFKVKGGDPNIVTVRLEGYRDEVHTFTANEKQPSNKTYTVTFTRRLVNVTALPYDAVIFINGEQHGRQSASIDVPLGQPVTVELKKPGFAPVKRTYHFERGAEPPPIADRLELTDRLVSVSTSPSGGAVFVDGVKIGEGTVDVRVPRTACVMARAEKPGLIPSGEKQYCNKDGSGAPPLEDVILFSGRIVNVTTPPEARIIINDQQAALGRYTVKITDKTCVNVRVELVGFITQQRTYCSHPDNPNFPVPPIDDNVALKADESFSTNVSLQTDQANNNIAVEVREDRDEATAWKLLSAIVLGYFDVLENSDRDTGYLRTAWQPKYFADGMVVIRTRMIVKRSSLNPLRYTVKIESERADWSPTAGASSAGSATRVSVKDDEKFAPWERLLNTYKDLISEIQARMR
jgi:hypothetical protein